MHHPSPLSSELGFLPSMYSFSSITSLPEMGINLGPPSTSHQLQGGAQSNTSWERRCLRKHRRRSDDEGCSAKKRKLMEEAGCDALETSSPSQDWPPRTACSALSALQSRPATISQPGPGTQDLDGTVSGRVSPLTRPETEGSCMEVESAQRRLQEIEDRITLEDDDDDEDLDAEPAPRRPVLVMSDSLREGLQRGISDILPHTVAQSVSHSCMELVVWRPPEDAVSRRLKDSLQRQRKQQTGGRHPPTPSPSTPPSASSDPPYSSPVPPSSGEEDMEL
ncbi:coiled-coil domain-containing protein 117 [Aplochiton taeniatus]